MAFHRLAIPTYYFTGGTLPTGYDLFNSPVTGGTGTGIATPAETTPKVGGTYDGVYFVAENEPVNANNTNRGLYALASNSDAFDNYFQRTSYLGDTVVTGHVSVGDPSLTFTPATSSLLANAGTTVVTTSSGAPLFANGTRVTIASVAGTTDAEGFFNGVATLTFNTTIPAGVTYNIVGATRATFRQLDGFAQTLFWNPSLVDGLLKLYQYDFDVVTVSDGTTSTGGDVDQADITILLNGTRAHTKIALRPGTYSYTNNGDWQQGCRIESVTPSLATIRLQTVTNVNITSTYGGLALYDVNLATTNTGNNRWLVLGDFLYDNIGSNATVEAGCITLNGSSASVSQRIYGMRLKNNATLTTATMNFEITGAALVDMANCTLHADMTGVLAGKTCNLGVVSFTGKAHIRDCVFQSTIAGVSAARIDSCGNDNSEIIFENCEFIQDATTGDAWAMIAVNSVNVTFRNCYFYSLTGQAVQSSNSGCRFENCMFVGGTNTALTNPQLVCGSGVISGSQQDRPVVIRNCTVTYDAANVRSTGATKAIVELGGIASAPTAGRVLVDGLYVRPTNSSVGYHSFTTLLCVDHQNNLSPNVYRNITVDDLGRTPTSGASVTHYDTVGITSANGWLVEVIGWTDRKKIVVENLSVVNVKAPATSLSRGVVGLNRCIVKNLLINGSTASAGSYNRILQTVTCDAEDIHIFPTVGIECSQVDLEFDAGSRIRQLRYHRRGLAIISGERWVNTDTGTALENCIFISDVAQAQTAGNYLIAAANQTRFINVTVIVAGVVSAGGGAGTILGSTTSTDVLIQNCRFRWANTTADPVVLLTGTARSMIMGNYFASTTVTAPVVTFTGTGNLVPSGVVIGVGDVNILAANAPATVPTIY